MHWSLTKEAHYKIEHLIDPSLNEKYFWGYIFKAYFIGPIVKRFKTKSMRLERISKDNTAKTKESLATH